MTTIYGKVFSLYGKVFSLYGKVFSLVEENPPISGCTTSETLMNGSDFSVVSLALCEGTGISDTIYDIPRL